MIQQGISCSLCDCRVTRITLLGEVCVDCGTPLADFVADLPPIRTATRGLNETRLGWQAGRNQFAEAARRGP